MVKILNLFLLSKKKKKSRKIIFRYRLQLTETKNYSSYLQLNSNINARKNKFTY